MRREESETRSKNTKSAANIYTKLHYRFMFIAIIKSNVNFAQILCDCVRAWGVDGVNSQSKRTFW